MTKKATAALTAVREIPFSGPPYTVPAGAVDILVPTLYRLRLTELWVNPGRAYAQRMTFFRYIRTPHEVYQKELLLPLTQVNGSGSVPTGDWTSPDTPYESHFIVCAYNVRLEGSDDVLHTSYPAKFLREGDTFKIEFEDIGADPTDFRMSFLLLPPIQPIKAKSVPSRKTRKQE